MYSCIRVEWVAMPIYLKYRGAWLRLKEVYQPAEALKSRRRRSRSSSTTIGMLVAESVEPPKLDGLRYSAEIPVSSTKVTRFAAYLILRAPYVTVIIEPRGNDYVAKIYSKSRKELEQHKRLVEEILRQVGGLLEEEVEEEEEAEEEEE